MVVVSLVMVMARVPHVADRVTLVMAMVMLVSPMGKVLYGMQRVMAVGYAPGGGAAGGVVCEGAVGSNR